MQTYIVWSVANLKNISLKSYLKLKTSKLKKADQHQMILVLKTKFKWYIFFLLILIKRYLFFNIYVQIFIGLYLKKIKKATHRTKKISIKIVFNSFFR